MLILASILLAPPTPVERKAILDAIRPAFVRAFHGQKLKFVVQDFGVDQGWAFVGVNPVALSGKPLNASRSDFAEIKRDGLMGSTAYLLLHRVGKRWKTMETAYFPTDVAWLEWPPKHPKAPKSIFPLYGNQPSLAQARTSCGYRPAG